MAIQAACLIFRAVDSIAPAMAAEKLALLRNSRDNKKARTNPGYLPNNHITVYINGIARGGVAYPSIPIVAGSGAMLTESSTAVL